MTLSAFLGALLRASESKLVTPEPEVGPVRFGTTGGCDNGAGGGGGADGPSGPDGPPPAGGGGGGASFEVDDDASDADGVTLKFFAGNVVCVLDLLAIKDIHNHIKP